MAKDKDKKTERKSRGGLGATFKTVAAVLGGAAVGAVAQAVAVEVAEVSREAAAIGTGVAGAVGVVALKGNLRMFSAGIAASGGVGYAEAKIEKYLDDNKSSDAGDNAELPDTERQRALAAARRLDAVERQGGGGGQWRNHMVASAA